MSTMMASLRRFIMRKRRCLLLFFGLLLILTLVSSWYHMLLGNTTPSPIEIEVKMTMRPVEPKFNVIEPPVAAVNEVDSQQAEKKENPDAGEIRKEEEIQYKTANISKNSTVIISAARAFQNQTEDIEVVKNKTLSQLGVLGDKQSEKTIPKVIFVKQRWNLTVSFEDIGEIMKDTSFLNKLKPLNLSGPMLTSTRNRTSNFSLSMPLKMGYCDCWERYCFCCVQMVNKRLHISNKTCANFTFFSKSHELDLTFSIDSKPVYNGIISADAPPLLCMGSIPAVADMCVHFFNMTYKVDRMGLHKSQIMGCTDMSLNIYNKTISVFPVDCFQIPGDPNHHPKEENIILPNFVP